MKIVHMVMWLTEAVMYMNGVVYLILEDFRPDQTYIHQLSVCIQQHICAMFASINMFNLAKQGYCNHFVCYFAKS